MAGVKGMKWGVRRSSAALRAAAATRKGTTTDKPKSDVKSAGAAKKPAGDIQDRVETSSDRYARLTASVKAGKASDMTEQDLKFVNARTEALAKVQKMAVEQPSWLKDTATKVVQQSAQRQMQTLADSLADKYIGDPLKGAVNAKAKETVEDAIQKGAADAIRKSTIEKGISELIKKRTA